MFVKHDLRKIPRILSDANSALETPPTTEPLTPNEESKKQILTSLRLSRRSAEFDGSLSILCQPSNVFTLRNLRSLNVYDCNITSLDDISVLAPTPDGTEGCFDLQELNVGRNPITSLPSDLAKFPLVSLWCDDCKIKGIIPSCIAEMTQLKLLRMSCNEINEIPKELGDKLKHSLEVLCLDGNKIENVPIEIGHMEHLKSLLLRQNLIKTLPEGVPGKLNTSLTLLHISSNQLTHLPNSIVECPSLTHIYANTNRIGSIPTNFGANLVNLVKLNISSNLIDEDGVSNDFWDRFGKFDVITGECVKDSSCHVMMSRNPIVDKEVALLKESESNNNKKSNVGNEDGVQPMEIAAN